MELNETLSELCSKDLKKLIELASEEPDKDIISLEEFNRLTEKWRTKENKES